MTAQDIVDVYDGHRFYITIANVVMADFYLSKHEKLVKLRIRLEG